MWLSAAFSASTVAFHIWTEEGREFALLSHAQTPNIANGKKNSCVQYKILSEKCILVFPCSLLEKVL